MQRANQLHFCSMSACLYDNHDQWPSPLKLSSNHVQRSKKIPMMSKFISDIVKKFNNICVGQVNQVLSALKPQEKATFTAILLFYIYIYIGFQCHENIPTLDPPKKTIPSNCTPVSDNGSMVKKNIFVQGSNCLNCHVEFDEFA